MKKLGIVFAFLLLLLLAFCTGVIGLQNTWNEKITLIIDTPTGVVSAYSIQRVSQGSKSGVASGGSAARKGEAVVIELPSAEKTRYLFALLQGGYLANGIYKTDRNWYTGIADLDDLSPKVLKGKNRPRLVMFEDVSDPNSLKLIDPDDLAASLGAEYSLKAITIEITDEDMTKGKLEEVLKWWLTYRGGPYNNMKPLKMKNDSPRGWQHIGALEFWSLDQIQEFDKR